MVPGKGSQLCAYAPTSLSDAKTISISIRRGFDGRASSIVLPREHHLARNLERLMTYDSVQSPQQPEYDVVSALSSVVQYMHTNTSRHGAPSASIAALFSSLRPPSDHARSIQRPAEQPTGRRSSKGRTRTTKHCKVLGCGNISVSRGLCRGHGGGRRCHYIGCSKSAQSRSVFCWSHGGGHRCEVENCMRSRKSKRFCADHVHLETQQAPRKAIDSLKMILNDVDEEVPTQMPRNASLPSLQDALRNTQQTIMF